MKLIKLSTDHYIIVDDSEIKEGDWFLPISGIGWELNKPRQADSSGGYSNGHCTKITHSTKPIEEGTTIHGIEHKRWNHVKFIDLSEVKELIGEVDVEKKAIKDLESYFGSNLELTDRGRDWVEGYGIGYNQALEDNKDKKYTEEDLKRYHNIMCLYGNVKGEEYIQSFQPKTEWEVEIVDGKLKLKLFH
jgi:hypothetical protein